MGVSAGNYPSNVRGGIDSCLLQLGDERCGLVRRKRNQKASRCLRVEKKFLFFPGEVANLSEKSFRYYSIRSIASCCFTLPVHVYGVGIQGKALITEVNSNPTPLCHLQGVADETKPRDVGTGMDIKFQCDLNCFVIERSHLREKGF